MAIGNQYDNGIGRATHLLQFYMRNAYQAAGLRWDSDNDAEIQDLVECIVAAAKPEPQSQELCADCGQLPFFGNHAHCDRCGKPSCASCAFQIDDGHFCRSCSASIAATPEARE